MCMLGLVLLAKAALLRGLVTILFVILSAWGLMSRLKFERTISEAEKFNEEMRRQFPSVADQEASRQASADDVLERARKALEDRAAKDAGQK